MAKETRSWEANDGSLHKTECDAAKRDLEILIAASPCAENAPYAKKLLTWLTSNPAAIASALSEYHMACPKAEAVAAERRCCSQCGRLEGEPHDFRHIAKYVSCSEAPARNAAKTEPFEAAEIAAEYTPSNPLSYRGSPRSG